VTCWFFSSNLPKSDPLANRFSNNYFTSGSCHQTKIINPGGWPKVPIQELFEIFCFMQLVEKAALLFNLSTLNLSTPFTA
jgi:hypothetical protein